MANQTAARAVQTMDGIAMESLPVLDVGSASLTPTYYRGAAAAICIDSATAGAIGYTTQTLDGTVDAIFAGVIKRTVTVPVNTDAMFSVKRQIPVKRRGGCSFNAVTTAGNAATPTAAWLGKKVWFVTDNEVSLTPPSQAYPLYAGRVVGINGMIGCEKISSTEVLVDITDAVGATPVYSYIAFDFDLAVLSTNNADYVAATAFGRRWFIRRAIVQIGLAVATGTITLDTLVNAVSTGTGTTVTGTIGAVTVRAINTVVDFNDTFTANFASSGDTTAGQGSLILEVLDLN